MFFFVVEVFQDCYDLNVLSDGYRFVRETTPCSLIRDSETIDTPGSMTRPTNSSATNQRRHAFCHNIPTAQDMEEFFANTEQLQQQNFQEQYAVLDSPSLIQ